MSKSGKGHDAGIQRVITEASEDLGLESYYVGSEMQFWTGNKVLLAEPDITFFLPDHRIILVEYKCRDEGMNKYKALYQLNRGEELLRDYFPGYKVTRMFAYGLGEYKWNPSGK